MVWVYFENLSLEQERFECNLDNVFAFLPKIQLDPEKSSIFIVSMETESICKS